MRLSDLLRDRQAKAEAASLGASRSSAVGSPEPVEDVWKIGRRDADAGISDGDRDLVVGAEASTRARPARPSACI